MPQDYLVVQPQGEQAEILEQLRQKLAKSFGVTLNGNRLAVRWDDCQVTMIVNEVTTPTQTKHDRQAGERYREVIDRLQKTVPHLEAELYRAEHGCWPK